MNVTLQVAATRGLTGDVARDAVWASARLEIDTIPEAQANIIVTKEGEEGAVGGGLAGGQAAVGVRLLRDAKGEAVDALPLDKATDLLENKNNRYPFRFQFFLLCLL